MYLRFVYFTMKVSRIKKFSADAIYCSNVVYTSVIQRQSHFDGIYRAGLYKLTKYKFPSNTTIVLYLFSNVCYMFWSYFEHLQALLYII